MLAILETQRQFYTTISQRAEAWADRCMEAEIRRDIEDGISVGLSVLDTIQRRSMHWLDRVECGADAFDQEKYDEIVQLYKQWLSDSAKLLKAIDAAEHAHYSIDHAGIFKQRYTDTWALLAFGTDPYRLVSTRPINYARLHADTPATKDGSTLIETYTGKFINVVDIAPSDVNWKDIAHSLSLTCRFSGHCRRFYSVAAHSLHCYYAAKYVLRLSRPLCICMLLHDAGEAFWHDLASPHKAAPHMSSYRNYLDMAQRSVYRAARVYATAVNAGPIMQYIDRGILKEEARRLLSSKGDWRFWAHNDLKPIHIPWFRWVWFLFPRNAERRFLSLINRWMADVGRRRHKVIQDVSV